MRIIAAALAAGLMLLGCSLGQPILRDGAADDRQGLLELRNTPFFPQEVYQCGPAALATVLVAAGKETSPQALAEQVYLPGRRGSLQVELLGATRRQGLLPYPIDPSLLALVEALRGGRPVLVLLDFGVPLYPVWHYAVVVGHDASRRTLILRSGSTRRKLMSERRFLAAWGRGGSWGLVVLRPGELPAAPDRVRYLEAVAALESAGHHAAAESAYRAALGVWPDDPTALLGLGNSLYGRGDRAGAERAYRRLIAAHPGSIAAYNNLAQVLAEGGQKASALDVLARGLSLAPEGHPLRATLEETRAEIRQGTTDRRGPGS
ncbi:MAG: PA2778 family cysteine peptidase [Bdellovibrio bacteriovorus]